MEKNFRIIIGSPIDYKNLVAFIWINNREVALVQNEKGNDNFTVEFFEEKFNCNVDVFIEALLQAKSELLNG
jgi:hypothetical protein